MHDLSENGDLDHVLDDCLDHFSLAITARYAEKMMFTVPKSKDWFVNILPSYDDERFKATLRISRSEFHEVLSLMENSPHFAFSSKRPTLSTDLQLAIIALFRMGNDGSGASYYNVSQKFGVGDRGTIFNCTWRVINSLLFHKKTHIQWPSKHERRLTVQCMESQLPQCVGFVDGSHIPLFEAPIHNQESYYNRKQKYSMQLQLISDHRLRNINAVVGYPGSVHDARVFKQSEIGRNPELYLSPGEWIAGDSAYKLSEWLITPFRDNSNVGTQGDQRHFNIYFSRYRVKIEHTFGILKSRFGSLNLRVRVDKDEGHKNACKWILACCVLYNILRPNLEDEPEDKFEEIEPHESYNSEMAGSTAGGKKTRGAFKLDKAV